jgi:hypothetical protein
MSGYRVEVAPSARAQCNGPKPCKGTKIAKGELRLGAWVPFKDSGSFKWRHWGCEYFGGEWRWREVEGLAAPERRE